MTVIFLVSCAFGFGHKPGDISAIVGAAEDTEMFANFRVCAATRSAQKGAEVQSSLLRQLFQTSKTAPTNTKLLTSRDMAIVVDVHVHAGDHALASIKLQQEMPCPFVHVLLQLKNKASAVAVQWTNQRTGSAKHLKLLTLRLDVPSCSLSTCFACMLKVLVSSWCSSGSTTTWFCATKLAKALLLLL